MVQYAQLPPRGKPESGSRKDVGTVSANERKKLGLLRLAVAAAGAGCLAAGLAAGQYAETLHKAILICLECVGIG